MPSYKRSRMWDGKARLYNMYQTRTVRRSTAILYKSSQTHLEYKLEVDIKDVGEPVSTQYVENLAKETKTTKRR